MSFCLRVTISNTLIHLNRLRVEQRSREKIRRSWVRLGTRVWVDLSFIHSFLCWMEGISIHSFVDMIIKEQKMPRWVGLHLIYGNVFNQTIEKWNSILGKCLSNLNVTAMDTRDSKGRGRFFPFVPEDHINTGKIDSGYWFWTSLYYPVTKVKFAWKLSYSRRNHHVTYLFRDWNAVPIRPSRFITSMKGRCTSSSTWSIG